MVKPSESAMAVIGFTFLFLLSLIIINGSLQYETGAVTNTTFTYDEYNRVNFTSQDISHKYQDFNDDTSHKFGYYLAIASVIGLVGVLIGLKRGGVGPDG